MPHPLRGASAFDELGWSGLSRDSASRGQVTEEWDRDLRGAAAFRQWREMRDSSVAGGMAEYFEALLAKPETVVIPNPDGERRSKSTALAAADFLEQCLSDMSIPWVQVFMDMLSAIWAGWASLEIIYMRRLGPRPGKDPVTGRDRAASRHADGRIGWAKIVLRGQETLDSWSFRHDGSFDGWWQRQETGQPVFIPLAKTVHIRFAARKDNPEGRSFYRSGKRSYYLGKRVEEHEAVGVVRDVGGTPILKVPKGMLSRSALPGQAAARASLETLVVQLANDQRRGLLYPHETDPETGKPSGFAIDTFGSTQNLAAVSPIVVRHEQRLAMSLLMHWMFLALDGVGAYGAQKNSSDISGIMVASKLSWLYGLLNRYLVHPLFRLNTWPKEYWPTLGHGKIDPLPPEVLTAFLAQLVNVAPSKLMQPSVQRELFGAAGLTFPEDGP